MNAQTKGIYIWGSPIEYTTTSGEKIKIILVDTEGIGRCHIMPRSSRKFRQYGER